MGDRAHVCTPGCVYSKGPRLYASRRVLSSGRTLSLSTLPLSVNDFNEFHVYGLAANLWSRYDVGAFRVEWYNSAPPSTMPPRRCRRCRPHHLLPHGGHNNATRNATASFQRTHSLLPTCRSHWPCRTTLLDVTRTYPCCVYRRSVITSSLFTHPPH